MDSRSRFRRSSVGRWKNASLGELINLDGVSVPNGFAIITSAWESFMNPLGSRINELLGVLSDDGFRDTGLLEKTSHEIRTMVEAHEFERDFECTLAEAEQRLGKKSQLIARYTPCLHVRQNTIRKGKPWD